MIAIIEDLVEDFEIKKLCERDYELEILRRREKELITTLKKIGYADRNIQKLMNQDYK